MESGYVQYEDDDDIAKAFDSSTEHHSSIEIIDSVNNEKENSYVVLKRIISQAFTEEDQRQNGYMDQFIMPRPCYYSLRLLGAWQPKNCHVLFTIYSALTYIILLSNMASILGLEFIHHEMFKRTMIIRGIKNEWRLGSIINACFTLLNLTCPFLFIKYYFRYGSYDQLVGSVFQSSFEHRGHVRSLSRRYTVFSIIAWFLAAVFFYVHWQPFFLEFWHYVIYFMTVFYTTGWWATWLSIYGFVCHMHSLQGQIFVENMQERFQLSNRTSCEERKRVGILLGAYNDLNRWIERTQSEFGVVVSFAMVYHTIDIVVFSIAYLDNDYGKDYPLWQYIGAVTFDLCSIAIKLYPAAIVSTAIHHITQRAGNECYTHHINVDMPVERFQFYQHLAIREQDIGMRILRVKISVRIAVGIFVTTVTALATVLRFIMVNMTTKHSLL